MEIDSILIILDIFIVAGIGGVQAKNLNKDLVFIAKFAVLVPFVVYMASLLFDFPSIPERLANALDPIIKGIIASEVSGIFTVLITVLVKKLVKGRF
ncbi:MAG: hypothetical protein KJ593_07375 [Candidatus Omnitrophica bacterium]|nr:hypothetical protein [Candidatus Omnitrophota bacterium]